MTKADEFRAAAAQRILIKDGPYGTQIQAAGLADADYSAGTDLQRDQKGNNDLVNLTQGQVIRSICDAYIDAGAVLLATNTFSANRISQADYGAEHLVRDINIAAACIIREAIEAASAKDGVPRFVAGAIGPTNKTLSLSPDVDDPGFREIDWDELVDVYREQSAALMEGGADFILVETVFDTLNAKAAIMAAKLVERDIGREVPIMLSMTLTDLSGRNLSGHTVEAFWHAVRHAKPLTIGLNCSFGATQLRPHVRTLSVIADCPIMIYPNAGLPNELGEYDERPDETAGFVAEWAAHGQVNVLGGCCGSTPAHIAAMAQAVRDISPRTIPNPPVVTRLAGLEPFEMAG